MVPSEIVLTRRDRCGDSDAVIPYISNEEQIRDLESKGIIVETEPWRPWFFRSSSPSGYVTKYKPNTKMMMTTTTNSTTNTTGGGGGATAYDDQPDLHFLTIRLAGHMVPTYQPSPSFHIMRMFLFGEPF